MRREELEECRLSSCFLLSHRHKSKVVVKLTAAATRFFIVSCSMWIKNNYLPVISVSAPIYVGTYLTFICITYLVRPSSLSF